MNTIPSGQNKDKESVTVRERFGRFRKRCERYRGYPTPILALLSVALYFAVRTFTGDVQPAQLRFSESASDQIEHHKNWGVRAGNEILSGQSYDTVLRLRESGALLMAVSLTAFDEFRTNSKFPSSTDAILINLQKRSQLPPGIEIRNGVLRSLLSEITIDYRSDPLSFEILSLPAGGASSPAILFRVPTPSGEPNSITYFHLTASSGSTIRRPVPFSPIEQLVASGWSIAKWRGEALPLDDSALKDLREQEAWLKSLNQERSK